MVLAARFTTAQNCPNQNVFYIISSKGYDIHIFRNPSPIIVSSKQMNIIICPLDTSTYFESTFLENYGTMLWKCATPRP